MNPRETIIQAFRTWAATILSLDDAPNQIIPAERQQKGPMPDKPFMVIWATVFGVSNGFPVTVDKTVAPDTHVTLHRGDYTANIRIMGIGKGSDCWLHRLALVQCSAPFTIQQALAVSDVSQEMEDNYIEERYVWDISVSYAVQTDPAAGIPVTPATKYTIDIAYSDDTQQITGEL